MSTEERPFIIDHTTKNLSFLKMYKHLKSKGIQNNKFFLKLYDPDLLGVDPYSHSLTRVQKAKMLQEIMVNPWYYYREVVKVITPGGDRPFELHRGNLAMAWAMHMCISSITVLPRQNYKTISTVTVLDWIYRFGTTNSNMLFFNKELKDSKLNLKRLKDMDKIIPQWLISFQKEDTDNIENIVYAQRGNSISVMSSPRDEDQADKLGRGCTVPLVWYDELRNR